MEDRFFKQKLCDRCHQLLGSVRTMSMFNTDCICSACADAERKSEEYKNARAAEEAAVRSGNRNFAGIGLPSNLKRKGR